MRIPGGIKMDQKNNNAITINVNDDLKNEIDYIARYYQRKPAELLRLLLTPVIINEYAKIQKTLHTVNNEPMKEATFNDIHL